MRYWLVPLLGKACLLIGIFLLLFSFDCMLPSKENEEQLMADYRYCVHTVTRLSVHLVWVTKYRYKMLDGDIKKRCRALVIQICDTEDVQNTGWCSE